MYRHFYVGFLFSFPREKKFSMNAAVAERTTRAKEYGDFEIFPPRIAAALEQPPNKGILRINNTWAPFYKNGMEIIREECLRRDVCDHGEDHVLNGVSSNILILKEAIPLETLYIRHNQEHPLFTDGSVVFVALMHDMGYAFKTITWNGKNATDHAQKGAKIMDACRKRILSGLVGNDDSTQESLAMLNEYAPAYYAAIAGDMLQSTGNPLLTSLLLSADKLDYFHAARVAGVTPPQFYDENKDSQYYYLAHAIKA